MRTAADILTIHLRPLTGCGGKSTGKLGDFYIGLSMLMRSDGDPSLLRQELIFGKSLQPPA